MNRVPIGGCLGQKYDFFFLRPSLVVKISVIRIFSLKKVRQEAVRVLPVLHFVPLVCEPCRKNP